MKKRSWGLLSLVGLLLLACGSGAEPNESGSDGNGSGNGSNGDGNGSDSGDGRLPGDDTGDGSGDGSDDGDGVCASESAEAQLRHVYLAFAFDVSGSMGKLDLPHHDPVLKWEPVVAATKSFFTDPDSASLSAALTFFPAASDRCDAESYFTPDVPMTALPSTDFGDAIDAITPMSSGQWRGGTPTLAVVEGTLEFLEPLAAADPDAIYGLVLVTDGHPQDCDDDEIASVAAAVDAVSDRIPTYVIGVQNPPGGPDSVSNLDDIAAAGGTEEAFLIETGDPEQTKADFKAVIDGIRGRSLTCDLEIPPPPDGEVFDPQKVNVTHTVGGEDVSFAYDQECEHDGTWRYDDPAAPSVIVLCPTTCDAVKSDPTSKVLVEFGCESRVIVR